jgi:alkyl sulfatase BDS1-like metallo-beta-lactamase superfamily hydrolase
LQADALEQMGYQAESGPWRAFYLTGAQELRYRRPPAAHPRQAGGNQLRALPAERLLDSLSVRLNGEKAGSEDFGFNLHFTDTGETFNISVENAVLHHGIMSDAPTMVRLTRSDMVDLVLGETDVDTALENGRVQASADIAALRRLLSLLDRFDFWFEIVAP